MQAIAPPVEAAFSGGKQVASRTATVFSPRRAGAQRALDVANEAARRWLGDIQQRRLGAKEFARHMVDLAREFNLDLAVDGYRAIAQCFEQEGHFDLSLKYYAKAHRAAPEDPIALNDYGASLGRMRQYKKSVRILRRALEQRRRHPLVLKNLALSLAMVGRSAEALSTIDAAVRIAPEAAELWMARAIVHWQAGRTNDAAADAARATERDPGSSDAWGLLATILAALGRPPDALAALDRAEAGGSPSGQRLLLRARVCIDAGRILDAAGALARFESSPAAARLRSDPDIADREREVRELLATATRLLPLADSIEISLPPDVDFADWKQLSAHLHAQGA